MLTWKNQPREIPTSFLWLLQLSVFIKIENKQTEISWEHSNLSCCDHLLVYLEQSKEMKNCYFFSQKDSLTKRIKYIDCLHYSRELFGFLFSFTWKDPFCPIFLKSSLKDTFNNYNIFCNSIFIWALTLPWWHKYNLSPWESTFPLSRVVFQFKRDSLVPRPWRSGEKGGNLLVLKSQVLDEVDLTPSAPQSSAYLLRFLFMWPFGGCIFLF